MTQTSNHLECSPKWQLLNECISLTQFDSIWLNLTQFDWIALKKEQIWRNCKYGFSSQMWSNFVEKLWRERHFKQFWFIKICHSFVESIVTKKYGIRFESRFQINAFKNIPLRALTNNNNNRDICELSFNFPTD